MKHCFAITLVAGLLFTGGAVFASNDREQLATQLNTMIPDLSCDDEAQCRSFGFGDKPCGGYLEYRLYSTKSIDEEMLLRKAEQYKALDKIYNEIRGGSSPCEVTQPIHASCIRGQCVSMGDELNYVTPIHYATKKNDTALIEELMADGYDINGLSITNETPLLYAIQDNAVMPETVKFLIEKGVDVNFKHGEKSNTALIYAVTQDRPVMVKILIEHGADPHLSNHWGNALDYAIETRNEQILNIFKEKGYNLKR